ILGRAEAVRATATTPVVAVAATEHKAVLAAAHAVAAHGGAERLLPVDPQGQLEPVALQETLEARPAVISAMWVNNETGVIHPVARLAEACRAHGVTFHSDLVQGFGKLPLNPGALPIGLATISGHKLGAPKGIGALLVRRGVALSPLVVGGSQQHGVRPGTENIAGAVGLGRAAALAVAEQAAELARLTALRARLLDGLRAILPDLLPTCGDIASAPHIVSVLVPGAETGTLLMLLDQAGISASGGSACATGAVEPSHVLSAMGIPAALARGVLRLSLGRETTAEDIARVLTVLPQVVDRARGAAGALSHG
ncbi:MAG: aminotransferase class V-fold PLP-dependent enzyme, partial [Gemmatimonadota bacterium]|nr:aminotransferase class V-fold PLP-dependent enzyme [Gemmatimonadota bacterium]